MGLLDSLFNQQTYGGQSGGLLDMLRSFQTQQQYQPGGGFGEAGLPAGAQPTQGGPDRMVPVGDYQMPQFGSPMPQQAAAAPQMQPQPQQAPSGPGPLMTGLQGFLGNLHNGPIGALAGGIGGLVTGERTDPSGIAKTQANQTAQALVQRGLDPGLAMAVARNPELLRAVLPQLMGTAGQTDDIKEYQFAKREDPSLTFDKFMSRKKSVTGEFGLTPIWGTGPDGKPTYIQPGKSGEARLANLPKGFEIARDPIKVDAGTHFVLLDPQTRQPVGTVPKNIQEKEAAEARGKIQGEAQAELPAVQITADRTIKQIDDFEKSAGFNEVFGLVDQFRPNFTMSDAGRKSLTQFKQLEGRAFLEGRAMLKGGGAITDFESNKAEAAIARLGRSQSEADAKEALQEFKEAVREGVAKLRAKAGGGSPTAAPSPPTTTRIRLNADGTIAQ